MEELNGSLCSLYLVVFLQLTSVEERQVAAKGSPPLRDGLGGKPLLEKEKSGRVGSGRSTILLWVGKILKCRLYAFMWRL